MFEINYEMSVIDMVLSFVSFIKHYEAVGFSRPKIEKCSGAMKIEGLKTIWTNEARFKISNPIDLHITTSEKAVIIEK